jgi:NitT/TauT family transport system substrate-binding protein
LTAADLDWVILTYQVGFTPGGTVSSRRRRSFLAGLLVLPLVAGLAACGDDSDTDAAGEEGSTTKPEGSDTTGAPSTDPVTLRLGYFPNLTHAPALVGVSEGIFEDNLPDNVTLETLTFSAGPEAVEALFADGLDITYIGPNPAINAYAQSDGEAVRIIAGSTSGGAFLVVRDGIDSVEQLAGTTLATPQLGNTQDVALRSFLADNGYETDEAGGGDVSITPLANADSLAAFQAGDIDGAWVPEPFASRFQLEGGAHVLVDERDLWPETDGEYVTTHVIVRTAFLEEHPDVVAAFLRGHLDALLAIENDPAAAAAAANAHIEELTTRPLRPEVLEAAFANLSFTVDPVAASLLGSAEDAEAVGLLDPVDLTSPGIYAVDILNSLLSERGEDEVEGL